MAITPVGSEAYKDRILELILEVGGNAVGFVFLDTILKSSKELVIKPYTDLRPQRHLQCRAASSPKTPGAAVPKDVSPQGKDRNKWYDGQSDDEDTFEDERHNPAKADWKATGGGSSVTIFFTPDEWSKSGCDGGAFGSMADEVLVHEMVHAERMMEGIFNPIPTLSLRYKNEEEFLAVVVTNMYMSKKGNTSLRKDYENAVQLQPPHNTSAGFLKDEEHKRILTHYSKAWQPMFGKLGNVDAPFNPFSQFKAPVVRGR